MCNSGRQTKHNKNYGRSDRVSPQWLHWRPVVGVHALVFVWALDRQFTRLLVTAHHRKFFHSGHWNMSFLMLKNFIFSYFIIHVKYFQRAVDSASVDLHNIHFYFLDALFLKFLTLNTLNVF